MMSGFQTLFDSIESKKHGLEVMLSELSPTELSLCPGPQRWSIQMILEHIIIMEEIIVREMEERLKNKSVGWDAKSPSSIRKLLFAMNKDVPVDIPIKELEPSGMSPIDELLSRWKVVRRCLRQDLDAIIHEAATMPIYRHPFGGPMDASETLAFMIAHLENHMRQIKRIHKADATQD